MSRPLRESSFCTNCGLPTCPDCGDCTAPVWPMVLTFQCDCGWSGLLDTDRMPAPVAQALRALWTGIERHDADG